MSDNPRKCEHSGCKADAVVGLQGAWLCLPHFEQGLKETKQRMVKLLEGQAKGGER